MRGGGFDGLPILLLIIIGVAYFGPQLARKLASSYGEITVALTPIVASVLLVVLVALVIRSYWSRW